MVCPNCKFQQSDDTTECPRCGVIFAKYHSRSDSRLHHGVSRDSFAVPPSVFRQRTKDALCPVDLPINRMAYGGRLLIYAGLVVCGSQFLSTPIESNYVGRSFMHAINLPFHEAGHVIFSPMGRFMQVLGGSLGQLLMHSYKSMALRVAIDLYECIADPKSRCIRRFRGALVVCRESDGHRSIC